MKVNFKDKKYLITDIGEVAKKACSFSGFKAEKLIYKGEVRKKDWIGSLVYEGEFDGREAILKIQGLKPEQNEPKIITEFMNQNKSKIIRTPYIFWYRDWNKKDGFGAFVMEKIKAPKIFGYPYSNKEQKHLFIKFYDDFNFNALKIPWEGKMKNEISNRDFFRKRLKNLKRERPDIKLPQEDKKRIGLFSEYIGKIESSPLLFTHGHLGADDIYYTNGKYVIASNLAWGYKPEFYNLAFIIWGCLHKIRDKSLTFKKADNLINGWFNVYKKSSYLKNFKDWATKAKESLTFLILASIVLQLYSDEHKQTASREELNTLLKVHRQLFDSFISGM